MEEEFGTGFQMERGIRENPLFRCPPSGNFSREDTSAIREEDKEGLTGRVGFDPCGSSDMVSPSNSIIRERSASIKFKEETDMRERVREGAREGDGDCDGEEEEERSASQIRRKESRFQWSLRSLRSQWKREEERSKDALW
ncbi:hypothetical protein CK203_063053, partial [Vitis vinifera]